MPVIKLVYANAREDVKLRHLSAEKTCVQDHLWTWQAQGDNRLYQSESADLAHFLHILGKQEVRENLVVLGFSGHAYSDKLIFNDEHARGKIIAKLTQWCPNLKMVILNGCSTWNHLEHLEQARVPIIISTTNSVGDERAKKFADKFFGELQNGGTIDSCFRWACTTVNAGLDTDEIVFERLEGGSFTRAGRLERETEKEPAKWMIRYREEYFKNWTLEHGLKDPPNPKKHQVLFDKQVPNIDFAVHSVDRDGLIGGWKRFWDERCEECTALQFVLEADTVHRPFGMVERFRRILELEYERRVTYLPYETNAQAKLPGFTLTKSLRDPIQLVEALRPGAGPDDVILLSFPVQLESCGPKRLEQWIKLMQGEWLTQITGLTQTIVLCYRLHLPPAKGGFIGRFFKKNASALALRRIKTVLQDVDNFHWIEQKDWEMIQLEHLRRWAETYTTRIDRVEDAAKERFDGQFPLRMSDVEGFIRDLIQEQPEYA